MVASAGITLGERTGWFSTLRWRYISSRPLTEDGVFQAPPLNVINGRVGYQFTNGWRIQLDALNLLNSSSYNASYTRSSRSMMSFRMLAGSDLLPTTPSIMTSMSRCASRLMDRNVTCGSPIQGDLNSGLKVTINSTRWLAIRSTA